MALKIISGVIKTRTTSGSVKINLTDGTQRSGSSNGTLHFKQKFGSTQEFSKVPSRNISIRSLKVRVLGSRDGWGDFVVSDNTTATYSEIKWNVKGHSEGKIPEIAYLFVGEDKTPVPNIPVPTGPPNFPWSRRNPSPRRRPTRTTVRRPSTR